MTKSQETPAADRIVTRTDNNPPETVGLLPAAEIPSAHKDKVQDLKSAHLDTYLMYLRVPEVIGDKDVYDRVTALSSMVKKAFDAIDGARTAAKKPYLDGGTAIDRAYAIPTEIDDASSPSGKKEIKLLAELKAAHDSLKKRLSAYDTAEYKKAEEARIAEQNALAAAAAADGIVLETSQVGDGKAQSTRSSYGSGATAVKKVEKTFRIVDPSKVPASLCSPDPDKIQAAIDAGAVEIAGVEIDVNVKTHVR